MLKLRYSYFIVTATLFFTALFSSAQILPVENGIILNAKPQFPQAGQEFTVEAKSYSFDASRANFRWLLNGRAIASGLGLTDQQFTAMKLGSRMTIDVWVTDVNGNPFSEQINIYVSDVDLIVRPLTYVPNFYKGVGLVTPGSAVEIFAVPHLFSNGSRISPQNLIYEWSVNGGAMRSQSGKGRDTLILNTEDIGNAEYEVKLKASSLGGSIVAQKEIKISTVSPAVLFYKTNELIGTSPFALTSVFEKAGETFSIIAEPYFFGLSQLSKSKVEWSSLNQKVIPAENNKLLLELSAPQNTASQSIFNLLIETPRMIFQRAEGVLSVTAQE